MPGRSPAPRRPPPTRTPGRPAGAGRPGPRAARPGRMPARDRAARRVHRVLRRAGRWSWCAAQPLREHRCLAVLDAHGGHGSVRGSGSGLSSGPARPAGPGSQARRLATELNRSTIYAVVSGAGSMPGQAGFAISALACTGQARAEATVRGWPRCLSATSRTCWRSAPACAGSCTGARPRRARWASPRPSTSFSWRSRAIREARTRRSRIWPNTCCSGTTAWWNSSTGRPSRGSWCGPGTRRTGG